jgi:hypothetical protein
LWAEAIRALKAMSGNEVDNIALVISNSHLRPANDG